MPTQQQRCGQHRVPKSKNTATSPVETTTTNELVAKKGKQLRLSSLGKNSVFRLAVWMCAYKNFDVSRVSLMLNVQPQDPRSLKRYVARSHLKGGTDYGRKFQDLKLLRNKVPNVAAHFFYVPSANETWEEDERPQLRGDRPRSETSCPKPTRFVGQQWRGGRGTYCCRAHKSCGCPDQDGQIAVIVKVSNRRGGTTTVVET